MSDRRRWAVILGACAAVIALLMQAPQWLHMADARYRGVPVVLNSDEQTYQSRVQEALRGRPEQAAEAITGDPRLKGAQSAQIEVAEGSLLAFTDWDAPQVFQLMDSVIPVLLFLALFAFLRRCGFSRGQALLGSGAFCLLQLYNLNRPLYQRTSFLVTIVTFLLLIEGVERRRWAGMVGGALLGFTLGGYFWAWTYTCLWAGLLGAWELIDGVAGERKDHTRWGRLALFGIVAFVAAIPALAQILLLLKDPLYEAAKFRSGMHSSHLPESWMYSALWTVMAAGVLAVAVRFRPEARTHRYALVTVVAGFLSINQQVLHGVTFHFVSHYLFALVLGAIALVLTAWALRRRSWLLVPSCLAAIVYLLGIGWDGRYVIAQWSRDPADFAEQHFATLLPVLEDLPRSRILTDPETSLFVAGSTKHDVVYSLYLKNVLLPEEELADRFCATQLPLLPQDRRLEERAQLLWPDAVVAFGKSARDREMLLVHRRCAALQADPAGMLRIFRVDYVLWDRARQPAWRPERLGPDLTEMASGSGWSLWEVRR